MQVCCCLMGASGIDFQSHKTIMAIYFLLSTSLKYKKWIFSALPEHYVESRKLWKLFWGKVENYFIISLLRILRLFLLVVVGEPSFACRLMFPGIYARVQVSERISSFILPEALRKRDVDQNGLRKVQLKS